MIMLTDGDAVVRAASSTTLVVLDYLTAKDGRHAVKGKGRAAGGGRGRELVGGATYGRGEKGPRFEGIAPRAGPADSAPEGGGGCGT